MKKLLLLSLITFGSLLSGCAVAPHAHPSQTRVIVVQEYPSTTFVSSYIYWNVRMSGHPHQNRFPYRR